ncbi:MAG: TIGR04219 family outer membrane beta-barrel protein [Campylobacterales bacterium]|nr:TIGR04219 family outer membrane beta-barrel protein [Campylobacterales bacterium]
MKKLTSLLASTVLFATIASADIARVEMGGGIWDNKPSGALTYNDGLGAQGSYTSSEKSNSNAYAWLLVKHPIPVLPNLRLEYTTLKDEGVADGSFEDFTIGGIANGTIEMSQYDAVLYYNILDNTAWITLDLGLDVKFIDLDFTATGNLTVNGNSVGSYTVSETMPLPMGYVRARVEIPGTDIGLEADGKYVTYDGSTVSDYRVKADYTLGFIPVVQPAIEVGYRAQKFDLKYNEEQTKFELDFSGFYAGVMLRF